MKKLFRYPLLLLMPLFVLAIACEDEQEFPPEPEIISVSPVEGPAGTVVTITGSNLEGVMTVKFGSVDAADFDPADNTPNTIVVSVPANAQPGAQDIVVTNESGTATIAFTVLEEADDPAPVITSISPEEGAPVGGEITIVGTDLEGVTDLSFGDIDQPEFTPTATAITSVVPEGVQEGTVTVRVTSPAGTAEFDYVILAAPIIAAVAPEQGPPGTTITLTGENFEDVSMLMFGEMEIATDAFTISDDGTTLTFDVPEDAVAGETPITLTAPGGTATVDFLVEDPVESIVFAPTAGPVGTEVVLTGVNFTGATNLMLGDIAIPETDFTIADDGSSVTFLVPEGASTGFISITDAEGVELVSEVEFSVLVEGEAINPNGGFENTTTTGVVGSETGPDVVEGWAFNGNDGELATISVVDTDVQEGSRALQVEVHQIGSNPWNIEVRQGGIAVAPNTTYTYSVWVKGPEGSEVDFTVGLPTFEELGRQTATMTGDWQLVTFTFTTGANDTEIRTPIHFSKEGNAGATFLIDNQQIMLGSE